jgi:hypothetical protein
VLDRGLFIWYKIIRINSFVHTRARPDRGVRVHIYTHPTTRHTHMPSKTPTTSRVTHTTTTNHLIVVQFTEIADETHNAWNLIINDRYRWLPKKCTTIVRKHKYITVPVWLAQKEDLITITKLLRPKGSRRVGTAPTMAIWHRNIPECTIDFRLKNSP